MSVGGTTEGIGAGLDSGTVSMTSWGVKRASRGGSGGSGGSTISLPLGGGGQEVAIDIHALIKWMKAHPGAIPKLVAHDMGHRAGDLSSAVPFRHQGKRYFLFLSCNEIELLLRICLIDGADFTLLKDNGIREESNFLIIGSVVREHTSIQSLISSRKAPTNRATAFYRIFWAWWQAQEK